MNITRVNKQTYNRNNTTFKNGQLLSNAFMAIDKHVILGVSAIDLGSMVIPRSTIDFTRNKQAGIETAFRESSSTATHATIGLAGLGAASLLALFLKNKNYGVDFKNITANDDTLEGMSQVFKDVVNQNNTISDKDEIARKFLNKVFEDVKGLTGNTDLNDGKNLWSSLKQTEQVIAGEKINTKNCIVELLLKEQKNNKSFRIPSKTLDKLLAYMNIDIPSTQVLKVKLGNKTVETEGIHLLEDAYSLTKSFTQDNVLKSFKKATNISQVDFVQDLKKLGFRKTVLGLSAMCAIALSMQTFNRYLTKKRTGIDGFVGDPNYGKNKNCKCNKESNKNGLFVPLKMLSMLGMGFFIYKTLNANSFKDLAAKLQFKGSLPTMNQIKLVYGSTLLGRLFAANDKNELRESAFRDFLGYTNFLILGSLVTKCYVNWKNKSLINYSGNNNLKGIKAFFNWAKESKIKTHQEIINSTLKQNVISENGIKPLKELYEKGWIKPNGDIAKKLSILNKAKAIGILYACVALGIVVPLINKHMTESKKRKSINKMPEVAEETKQNKFIKIANTKAENIFSDFLKSSSNNNLQ